MASEVAKIDVKIDAAPGTDDTAGRMAFYVTKDGFQTPDVAMTIYSVLSVVTGKVLATTATGGFLYIPSCAGPPTGIPVTRADRSAIVHDTTSNRLEIYNDVTDGWEGVALA